MDQGKDASQGWKDPGLTFLRPLYLPIAGEIFFVFWCFRDVQMCAGVQFWGSMMGSFGFWASFFLFWDGAFVLKRYCFCVLEVYHGKQHDKIGPGQLV